MSIKMNKKAEVIVVPENECPMDALAKLGSRTEKAWIYFSKSAAARVNQTKDIREEMYHPSYKLIWNATNTFPYTSIVLSGVPADVWQEVCFIEADDIAFKSKTIDPVNIFFLTMEE